MFGVLQGVATSHHFATKTSAIEGLVPEDRKYLVVLARQTLTTWWDKPLSRDARCGACLRLAKK
jgi:hypothetical protein